ncbi:hypothetical protein Hanom_Chr01g00064311 [Helianthus anomalus]
MLILTHYGYLSIFKPKNAFECFYIYSKYLPNHRTRFQTTFKGCLLELANKGVLVDYVLFTTKDSLSHLSTIIAF